jgi:hypothetical protein
MVAVKSTLKMGISFGLQEVVIMTFLREKAHGVIMAVVTDLLNHGAHSRLVLSNELSVLDLFALEDLDEVIFFGESTLEFGKAPS